jgi:hypothetical protein
MWSDISNKDRWASIIGEDTTTLLNGVVRQGVNHDHATALDACTVEANDINDAEVSGRSGGVWSKN